MYLKVLKAMVAVFCIAKEVYSYAVLKDDAMPNEFKHSQVRRYARLVFARKNIAITNRQIDTLIKGMVVLVKVLILKKGGK